MNGILNISGKTNVWDALIMQLIDKNELSSNQWHKIEAYFFNDINSPSYSKSSYTLD